VQAEITRHQWNEAQANAYVAFQAANPNMLTNGLEAWFKADDATKLAKDGSNNVTSWADETGNWKLIPSSSAPTYVTSDLNSKPGVHFNGSQWLSSSSPADPGLNEDMTMISVGMNNGSTTQTYSMYLGPGSAVGANRGIGYYLGNELFDTSTVACSGSAAPTSGTFSIEAATLDALLNNVAFYRNGAATQFGSLNGVQNLSAGFMMGSAPGGNYGWQGDIVEQLVYDHKLSTSELQQVSLYLCAKYGLAYNPPVVISPAGGSYTTSPTITLSTSVANSVIHYTIDGTQPTANSSVYSAAFPLSSSALVQAAAFVSGNVASSYAAAQYYVNDPGQSGLPVTPTLLKVTSISSTETDLSWSLTGFVNYSAIDVYRSTSGGAYILINVLDPTATSYADLNVVAGHSYTYEIGTFNQSGISDTAASTAVTPPGSSVINITVTTPSGTIDLP
jgi:hypothetical protein